MVRDLWVFGYGSLIWRPGFETLEAVPARLAGFRRSLCVFSIVYRGTPERPGLVFGLDRGGECAGIALRVGAEHARAVIAYLRAREQVTRVYLERWLTVSLARGGEPERVRALCYVADPTHVQYAGGLNLAQQAAIVARGWGRSGPNVAYVRNTAHHLRELGIRDRGLDRLMGLIGRRPSHAMTWPANREASALSARLSGAGRAPPPKHRLARQWRLRINHRG